MDAESEKLIQEALQRVSKGRTVLTIAHRLSTIKNAGNVNLLHKIKIYKHFKVLIHHYSKFIFYVFILDKLAVLYNGKIAELGSYEDLMSVENGLFRKLNKNQVLTS